MLDLDHTLLNSASYSELDAESDGALQRYVKHAQAAARQSRELLAASRKGDGGDGQGESEQAAGSNGEQGACGDGGRRGHGGSGSEQGRGGEGGGSDTDGAADFEAAFPSLRSAELLCHLSDICMWTKLRPFVFEFLKEVWA